MKISKVEAILFSYPMPEPIELPFWGGLRTILKRDAMVIRVKADNGLEGFGPGPAHEEAARRIQALISPFLVGKDPLEWAKFRYPAETVADEKLYHAVEVALLDLVGRFEQCPVSELIGGRCRDTIKLYGSAGMYMEPEGFAEEAAAIQGMGFPAYKMRPALGPDRDLRTVELMRAATGPDFGLMIDAHSWWRMGNRSYTLETVKQLAQEMSAYRPFWLEEPIIPHRHDDYIELMETESVPVASGEHEQEEQGFLDLIERKAVHYVQMDVCCQGGMAMGKRVMASAQKHGIRFAFHSWGNDLEVLAAAHLGICWPETTVEWLEYPCYANDGKAGMYPFPIAQEILEDRLEITKGFLDVPSGPGLGIEVNLDLEKKYPFQPGPWSYFKLEDPPSEVAVTGDHSIQWVDTK